MKRLALGLFVLTQVGFALGVGGWKQINKWPKQKPHAEYFIHDAGSRAERRAAVGRAHHRQQMERGLQQQGLMCGLTGRQIMVGTLIFGVVFARTYLTWQDLQKTAGK